MPLRVVPRDLFKPEFRHILVAALAVLALLVFLGIAEAIHRGTIERFDQGVLLAMRDPVDPMETRGPVWLTEMMRDLTALGGITVIVIITVTVVGLFLLKRRFFAILMVLTAVIGGAALESLLKHAYGRARPDMVSHLAEAYSLSFPSGHSMMSAVVYLSLAALVARAEPSPRVRAYILAVALTLVLLIGLSRIYLGVHYPTDVLGGWALGFAWACLCWLLGRRLRLQRHMGVQAHPSHEPEH